MIDSVAGNSGQKTTDVGKLFVKCVKNHENMSTGLSELFAVIVIEANCGFVCSIDVFAIIRRQL